MWQMPLPMEIWFKGLMWLGIWYFAYDHCSSFWRKFWAWFGVLLFTAIQPF